VNQLNQRWNALNSMTAKVEIQATELKTPRALEKDDPSSADTLSCANRTDVARAGHDFGVKIFDMASDGSHFTL
jgi:hypothetical protein